MLRVCISFRTSESNNTQYSTFSAVCNMFAISCQGSALFSVELFIYLLNTLQH